MSPVVNRYRIAIVVQGRFHMFDLARELSKLGHDVTVFTPYPAFIARKFRLGNCKLVTNPLHGLLSRLMTKWGGPGWQQDWQDCIDVQFGRWASKTVPNRGPWDAIISMSGISLEMYRKLAGQNLTILHRGSVHIEVQRDMLLKEQLEKNKPVRLPSPLIIRRELQEYELCTRLTVISPLARESFVGKPVPPGKIDLVLLGIDVEVFAAKGPEHDARNQRYNGTEPLRVVCAGSFSRRKGSAVWNELFEHYPKEQVLFRIVGEINPDSQDVYDRYRDRVEFLPRVPEHELPTHYQWADLFLLPTVEDGFAVVVAQALSGALPVLTTTGCGAACLIDEGKTGWIVPVNDAKAMFTRLDGLVHDRQNHLAMLDQAWERRLNYSNLETAKATLRQIERYLHGNQETGQPTSP